MSSTLVWAMGIQLKGMNRPTERSFICKAILDATKTRVCSLVDSCAVCLRRNCPLSNRRTNRENSYPFPIEIAPASKTSSGGSDRVSHGQVLHLGICLEPTIS